MNKAALVQLEHFNKSNALAGPSRWACLRCRLFTPSAPGIRLLVSRTTSSSDLRTSLDGRSRKAAYIRSQPKIWNGLKDEIYRVCYMSQASGEDGGARPESGASKQRDFAITQEVLRSYGDTVKDTMRRILEAICGARQDDLAISVTGLDEFDIGDFVAELSEAQTLLALGIDSPTMKRQVFQKLAFKYLCDIRQEVKDQIAKEIESQTLS